jgi:hypothetical protein
LLVVLNHYNKESFQQFLHLKKHNVKEACSKQDLIAQLMYQDAIQQNAIAIG